MAGFLRLVPDVHVVEEDGGWRTEVAGLRSTELWLALLACACVTASTLTVYSFIEPLLVEQAGLDAVFVPLALSLFGLAALIGSFVGGRFGDSNPFLTPTVTGLISMISIVALLISSSQPTAVFIWFTLLGLAGMSANPALVSSVIRYGGGAPLLSNALATSMFNVGTAVGMTIAGFGITGLVSCQVDSLKNMGSSGTS